MLVSFYTTHLLNKGLPHLLGEAFTASTACLLNRPRNLRVQQLCSFFCGGLEQLCSLSDYP